MTRSAASLRHLTLCVRCRLDIRRRFSRRHLRIGALAGIGAFFILAAEIASSIAYCFDQLERIRMMRGCEPGELRFEPSFILGDNAFENTRGDRARDRAAVAEAPCTITAIAYLG